MPIDENYEAELEKKEPTVSVTVRIPASLNTRLMKLAKYRDVPLSWIVRMGLNVLADDLEKRWGPPKK